MQSWHHQMCIRDRLLGEEVTLDELLKAYEGTLDPIFPRRAENIDKADPVSYTHLDVYKRQVPVRSAEGNGNRTLQAVHHA